MYSLPIPKVHAFNYSLAFFSICSLSKWLKVEMMKPFTVSPWDGAQTTLYTVLADNLIPGAYYSNCAQHATNKLVESDEERKWLWEKSCELVGLNKDG